MDEEMPRPSSEDIGGAKLVPKDNLGAMGPETIATPESTIETAAEHRKEIAEHLAAPDVAVPHTAEVEPSIISAATSSAKPRGFREAPLKVLRNAIQYPTYEAIMIGTFSAFGVTAATSALGIPAVGLVGVVGAGAYLVYEMIRAKQRERKVSDFFRVMKVKPGREKVLQDGTQVGLDDSVGELHTSGVMRLRKLVGEKDKVKRALIVSEGILQGLDTIGEKLNTNDPWFTDFKAFKGTSWIVNPRIAERFGFEVGPSEMGSILAAIVRATEKLFVQIPQLAPENDIRTAWISRDKFLRVHTSGIVKEELAKIRRGLDRRNHQASSPA